MNKYVRVYILGAEEGDSIGISMEVPEDMVEDTIKTIANKVYMVVSYWGYCEYPAMYCDFVNGLEIGYFLSKFPIEVRFDGAVKLLQIYVADNPSLFPVRSIEESMHRLDKFLLKDVEFNPNTDLIDLNYVLPRMTSKRYK